MHVECPTKTLILLHGKNYDLKLTNYITANFGLKNVETSIIDNFGYFKLNGQKLDANNKFKILNSVLNFYSEDSKKISVKFRNYGTIANLDALIAAYKSSEEYVQYGSKCVYEN